MDFENEEQALAAMEADLREGVDTEELTKDDLDATNVLGDSPETEDAGDDSGDDTPGSDEGQEQQEKDKPETEDEDSDEDDDSTKKEKDDEEGEGKDNESEEDDDDDSDDDDEDDSDDDEDKDKDKDEEKPKNEIPQWLRDELDGIEGVDTSDPKKAISEIKNKYTEAVGELEKEAKANEQLIDLLDANPVVEQFLATLQKGHTPEEAIVMNLDLDDLIEMKEDPKLKEKLIEARVERKFQKEQQSNEGQKLEKNATASKENIDSFAESRNMDKEATQAFTQQLDNVLKPLSEGLVTTEMLEVFQKGLNYDKAIKEAQKKAQVQEKNKKVEKSKKKKKGDGLPDGQTRKTVTPKSKNKETFAGVPVDSFEFNQDPWL